MDKNIDGLSAIFLRLWLIHTDEKVVLSILRRAIGRNTSWTIPRNEISKSPEAGQKTAILPWLHQCQLDAYQESRFHDEDYLLDTNPVEWEHSTILTRFVREIMRVTMKGNWGAAVSVVANIGHPITQTEISKLVYPTVSEKILGHRVAPTQPTINNLLSGTEEEPRKADILGFFGLSEQARKCLIEIEPDSLEDEVLRELYEKLAYCSPALTTENLQLKLQAIHPDSDQDVQAVERGIFSRIPPNHPNRKDIAKNNARFLIARQTAYLPEHFDKILILALAEVETSEREKKLRRCMPNISNPKSTPPNGDKRNLRVDTKSLEKFLEQTLPTPPKDKLERLLQRESTNERLRKQKIFPSLNISIERHKGNVNELEWNLCKDFNLFSARSTYKAHIPWDTRVIEINAGRGNEQHCLASVYLDQLKREIEPGKDALTLSTVLEGGQEICLRPNYHLDNDNALIIISLEITYQETRWWRRLRLASLALKESSSTISKGTKIAWAACALPLFMGLAYLAYLFIKPSDNIVRQSPKPDLAPTIRVSPTPDAKTFPSPSPTPGSKPPVGVEDNISPTPKPDAARPTSFAPESSRLDIAKLGLGEAEKDLVMRSLTSGDLEKSHNGLNELKKTNIVTLGSPDEITNRLTIVYPVRKVIETTTPNLEWKAIKGAVKYELSIYGEDFNEIDGLKNISLSGTVYRVPAGKLVKGEIYRFAIIAKDAQDKPVSKTSGSVFQILSLSQEEAIKRANNLPNAMVKYLLLVHLRTQAGLFDKAQQDLQKLEAYRDKGIKGSALDRLKKQFREEKKQFGM